MTNGKFKRLGDSACARAKNVFSTQSRTDFEWSVELFSTYGITSFYVGIASQLDHDSWIVNADQNAILYNTNTSGDKPIIQSGGNTIHSNLRKHKTGDVIRFRFKPQTKKLLINLVRI